MHTSCHQVCLGRKPLNTKRLSRHACRKRGGVVVRDWDWLFRSWDAQCQHCRTKGALQFWQKIIDDSLNKACWSWGCVSAIDLEARTIRIADAHRGDRKRFVLHADEKLTAFGNWNRQLSPSVLLPFCKSERNGFAGGRIAAPDSGLRIAKRIHL